MTTFKIRRSNIKTFEITIHAIVCIAAFAHAPSIANTWDEHGPLEVSANKRYLQHKDGTPFLWLGGTAWSMYIHANREDVIDYLDNRKAKGFTAVQAVAYPFATPNKEDNHPSRYGHRPFEGTAAAPDLGTPRIVAGGSPDNPNDYWDHSDFIVRETKKRGLLLALLPCWGSGFINNKWWGSWHDVQFTEEQAYAYGKFLAARYKNEPHMVWAIGGDTIPDVAVVGEDNIHIFWAMAKGVVEGGGGEDRVLMTYHPCTTYSSSQFFNEDSWLDFHMIETHTNKNRVVDMIATDYAKRPTRPTMLGEGHYESGRSSAHMRIHLDAFHTYLSGGMGYVYGSAVWNFHGDWRSHLDAPGASDLPYIKKAIASREWWKWIPDQKIFENGKGEAKTDTEKVAVKSSDGDEIVVYFADNSPARIRLNRITTADTAMGTWFNPSDGNTASAGAGHATSSTKKFTPPEDWSDAVLILEAAGIPKSWDEHGALGVSENGHYIQHADGTPHNWRLVISEDSLRIQKADGSDWYWLGDTAWSLFQELNREDAEAYFSMRASQGFTVLQAVVVMGWNRSWNDANVYGDKPFNNDNEDSPNEAFWQHADWIIDKAKDYGLYIGILPAWGSHWANKFSEASAERYATWIANRYKNKENIIWVNGGDIQPSSYTSRFNRIGNAFHNTAPNHLATFHARSGMSNMSSTKYHTQAWLDFNMFQTGHGKRDRRSDEFVDKDWVKTPAKPTLDGEQCYEDHHIGWSSSNDTFKPYDVRQVAYWSVFAGGTGVTYGHVHVWDFYHGGNKEDGYKDWKVQMLDDGAVYMGILHQLMMSRPHAGRGPAQHLFNSNPSGSLKQRATQGDGYVMAYTSQGQNINIQMPFAQNTCWWFNPRDGIATLIGTFAQGSKDFDCPGGTGRDHDWVLVIDDASKGYTTPGKVMVIE